MWILAKIVAVVTKKPRYFPEVKWSTTLYKNGKLVRQGLWTHNVFRIIGMVIGEPYGIRVSMHLQEGKQYAYTFEGQVALFEAYIRAKIKKLSPKLVRIPQYQIAGLSMGGLQPYRFTLSFDTSLQGTNNNSPVSFTATGADGAMFANTLTDITANSNGNVSSMAYGATTLNLVSTNYRYPSDRWNVGACAGGITAGTANISETGSTFNNISATSYSGCASSNPDSSAGSDNGGATTSALTISTTVVATGCWLAGSIYGGGSYTAGTGTTRRTNAATSVMDSNGTVGTGSQSLVMNQANDFVAANIVSIAPFVASTAKPITSDLVIFN